jgi:alpha-glucoside transport system substrate-binding protein
VREVVGPLGMRGVYDLPFSDLANLARASTSRNLSPNQCAQLFPSGTCPPIPAVFPAGIRAYPVEWNHTTVAEPLADTTVTLFSAFDTTPKFRQELTQFTQRTGIRIKLVGNPGIPGYVEDNARAGTPPDLAFFGSPQEVVRFGTGEDLTPAADSRRPVRTLIDLGGVVDTAALKQSQSPYLVSLGTVGKDGSWPSAEGTTYGAAVNLGLKSLIWYPVPEFRAAGYMVPRTWSELLDLSRRMVADGRTPWCMGWGSPDSNGWPGTDWIENLVLSGAGADAYDQWTVHRIPFQSPTVRTAFQQLGQILFPKGFVDGGPAAASRRLIDDAQTPMVRGDPPGCWLYQFPGFATQFVPPHSLRTRTAFFPFPSLTAGSTGGMLGGAILVGAFSDRPEVREVLRFFLGPDFGANMVTGTGGSMSPNRHFDTANYPPALRRTGEALKAALAADSFRMDASDLMPAPVGFDAFFKGMLTYAREGPGSLDRILRDIDAAWPDEG